MSFERNPKLDPRTSMKGVVKNLQEKIEEKKNEYRALKEKLNAIDSLYNVTPPFTEKMQHTIEDLLEEICKLENRLVEIQTIDRKTHETDNNKEKNPTYQPTFFQPIEADDDDRLGRAIAKAAEDREKAISASLCCIL